MIQVSPLKVIVFPGGFNWPLWTGQALGFFARHGLEITLTPTPNSVVQLTSLIAGDVDIAITAIDNVIAYQEGQGEVPVGAAPDLFAFMGGDHGFLRLIVQPEIRTYADLRGQVLSVDAMTTGFAFVLRKMLELGGLEEGEYSLVRAGGVRERWNALKDKRHAGTLLLTPFELLAESIGLRRLGNAVDVIGPYQGHLGATRRSWARDHAAELVAFIRAYRASLAWLFDPAHRAEAVGILRRNAPDMPAEIAQRAYDVLLSPVQGFQPQAKLDVEGIRTVLRLRSEYGRPRKELTDPTRYYNLTYYDRAGAKA
ncbi:MAG TPA: ABC transporter substrate-binding protein [Methylomirabilota bacterium]|jgi:ABC-type nitrate/sulfonate/bicarbonate transport system substrate-binding protein|nr:ABC transporter substrate-binding protein [Methylomirabilota bacterium]